MHDSCHQISNNTMAGAHVMTVANSNTLLHILTYLLQVVVMGSIAKRLDEGVQ
jgi:hypothetical protein